jgi:hypothetical protein
VVRVSYGHLLQSTTNSCYSKKAMLPPSLQKLCYFFWTQLINTVEFYAITFTNVELCASERIAKIMEHWNVHARFFE